MDAEASASASTAGNSDQIKIKYGPYVFYEYLFLKNNEAVTKIIEEDDNLGMIARETEASNESALQALIQMSADRKVRIELLVVDSHLKTMPGHEFVLRARAAPGLDTLPFAILSVQFASCIKTPPSDKPAILFIDRPVNYCKVTGNLFTKRINGCTVHIKSNSEEALAYVRDLSNEKVSKIKLVITDVGQLGEENYPVVQTLKGILTEASIVVSIPQMDHLAFAPDLFKKGVTMVVSRPFNREHLPFATVLL